LEEANRKLHEQYLNSVSSQMKTMFQSKHEIVRMDEMSETVQNGSHNKTGMISTNQQESPPVEINQNYQFQQQQQQDHQMMNNNNMYPNMPFNNMPSNPYQHQQQQFPPSNNPGMMPIPTPTTKTSGRYGTPGSRDENEVIQLARQQTNALAQEHHEPPSNRIVFKPKGQQAQLALQQPTGSTINPRAGLPPVIETSSPAGNSANLFASAVNMYNSVNRVANRLNDARNSNPQRKLTDKPYIFSF
jgi:pyruvate/2-oxoglutarate dehydrogenase complex dihydrolipoamide acyltransferase (E2) component